MKIVDITVFSYEAKYAFGTYSMSGGRTSTGQPSIVIRIRTDNDIEGWAESAPLGSDYLPSSFTMELAALREIGPLVIGMDPRSPAVILAVLDRAMLGGKAAKSVIDFACWDIFGKSVGLPTYMLLGGKLSEDIPAFSVVGIGSPEFGVKKALAECEKGVVAMQLKCGDDPINDAKRIRAIRQAIPSHVDVFADANTGWNLEQALTFARALGQDITVPIEQPCKTLHESVEVGRRTGLPIILDECVHTVADLIAAHAAGVCGVNLKASRIGGGFTKARILRDAAVALDMMVVIDDTWGGSFLTAQNLQMGATTRRDRLRAVDCFTEWTTPLVSDAPRMQSDGRVVLKDLPGNGYGTVNLELLGEPLFQIKA